MTGDRDVRLEELEFSFPASLIAQRPVEPRDACRLMHLRADGAFYHGVFSELPDLLQPGDTLVFNDSRVLPARVEVVKPTGGKVELLFLRALSADHGAEQSLEGHRRGRGELWEALARPSHRLKTGGSLVLPGGDELTLRQLLGEGRWVVEGPSGVSLVALMEKHGRLPLPPYIRDYPGDPENYQTVYGDHLGSAAAPTAGLHFTQDLLQTLQHSGIERAYVTLHVGLDTFQPIREEVVERHRIHRETYYVSDDNLRVLRRAKARGERLVAVGTTATRVLETLAGQNLLCEAAAKSGDVGGDTEIFITPGHRFGAVDALLTNFHLPRSSVLALTMAFAGVERLRCAYAEAIELSYRFFSFGDAMLIEPGSGATAAQNPAPMIGGQG